MPSGFHLKSGPVFVQHPSCLVKLPFKILTFNSQISQLLVYDFWISTIDEFGKRGLKIPKINKRSLFEGPPIQILKYRGSAFKKLLFLGLKIWPVLIPNFILWFQIGISVGHLYYFLEDVFPNQPGGLKVLKTIKILKVLCDQDQDEPEPQAQGKLSFILNYLCTKYRRIGVPTRCLSSSWLSKVRYLRRVEAR